MLRRRGLARVRRWLSVGALTSAALVASGGPAAAEVTAVMTDGSLQITGTDGADSIRIGCQDGMVTVSGQSTGHQCGAIQQLAVDAAGGGDVIDLAAISLEAGFESLEEVTSGGGEGEDRLTGSDLAGDMLDGGSGIDRVVAKGGGTFVLSASSLSMRNQGTDLLSSIERATLVGSAGNNIFRAADFPHPVRIAGGPGNDVCEGGPDGDVLVGGLGVDRVVAEADQDMTLTPNALTVGGIADSLSGMERAVLSGGGNANTIDASAFGGGVNLNGGAGTDTLRGGSHEDDLFGDGDDDLLVGGGGRDVLDAGEGDDAALGERGNDILIGRTGSDTLRGGRGDDVLDGGEGKDVLIGGPGRDRFYNP